MSCVLSECIAGSAKHVKRLILAGFWLSVPLLHIQADIFSKSSASKEWLDPGFDSHGIGHFYVAKHSEFHGPIFIIWRGLVTARSQILERRLYLALSVYMLPVYSLS